MTHTLLSLALAGCTGDVGSEPAESAPPVVDPDTTPVNLLVIVVDTLRYDHITAERAPHLASLRDRGVAVENLHGSTFTYSGVGAYETAMPPADWGAESWNPRGTGGGTDAFPFMSTAIPRFAEAMERAGFVTGVVTANDVGGSLTGLDQGYGYSATVKNRDDAGAAKLLFEWWDTQTGPRYGRLQLATPHDPYDRQAVACQAEVAEATTDNPCPYSSAAEGGLRAMNDALAAGALTADQVAGCHREVVARYGCQVQQFDTVFEDVWAEVEQRNLLDDTLVVVFTDHGEALLDDGEGQWTDHGFAPWSSVSRGFAVFLGGGLEPGTIDRLSGRYDLVPSIADVMGLDLDMPMAGASVFTPPTGDELVRGFWCGNPPDGYSGRVHGVWWGDWHFVYRPQGEGKEELYAAAEDPAETTNLYTTDEEVPPSLLAAAVEQESETASYCFGQ